MKLQRQRFKISVLFVAWVTYRQTAVTKIRFKLNLGHIYIKLSNDLKLMEVREVNIQYHSAVTDRRRHINEFNH